MILGKNKVEFEKAVKSRKAVFDKALKFYNSNSFQWNEYPKNPELNEICKTKLAVYAFFIKNPRKHVNKILAAVESLKKTQQNNKLPKVNDDYVNLFKEIGCLYIGSVTSESLYIRIKQHWRLERNGDKGNGTYALKISDWLYLTDLKMKDFTVYYCEMFDSKTKNQDKELVRVVEDCLATMYCPLLGKRGDSPKG